MFKYNRSEENTFTKIEHSFNVIENTFSENDNYRKSLIDKLMSKIDNMELTGSARDVEVQLQAINSVAGLLNDRDKQSNNYTKLVLSEKSDEDQMNVGKSVIELLKYIKVVDDNVISRELPMDSCDGDITKVFKESCTPIPETELRIDSDDVS